MEKDKNELLKEYFCAVTVDDILTASKTGKIFLNGVELTEGQASALKVEAEFFRDSHLAKIFFDTLYSQAQKIMFEKAESFDDMRNGKMMMYNISVQKNIIKLLCNYKSK